MAIFSRRLAALVLLAIPAVCLVVSCETEPFAKAEESQALSSGGVESEHLADGSVTTDKLADGAVTSDKLASDTVTGTHLMFSAVGNEHIQWDAVASEQIADDAVDSEHIAEDAVDFVHIADDAVNSVHIADDAVDSQHIASDAVDSQHIARDAVDSEHIANDAVDSEHIANNAVDSEHIANNAVDSEHIASNAVGATELAEDSVDSDELADKIDLGVGGAADGDLTIYGEEDSHEALFLEDNRDGAGGARAYWISGVDTLGDDAWRIYGGSYGATLTLYDKGGLAGAGIKFDSSGDSEVWGDSKTFVTPHPADESKRIVYTSLEGPEAAAYMRGTGELVDGYAYVVLPEHFELIVTPDDMTASVTPTSTLSLGLAVTELAPGYMVVEELGGGRGSYEFHYRIEAVRVGYEDYRVIREASEYDTEGIEDQSPVGPTGNR